MNIETRTSLKEQVAKLWELLSSLAIKLLLSPLIVMAAYNIVAPHISASLPTFGYWEWVMIWWGFRLIVGSFVKRKD